MTEKVTFWFDTTCPFCWQTSRWMKEVEKVRDIEIDWVPMSLAVLNEGRELPDDYRAAMDAAWGPARVFAKVKKEKPEKIDELYTAMGTLIHVEKQGGKQGAGAYTEIISAALDKVGLPASYTDVAGTNDVDDLLRGYHASAIEQVGDDVGTPVMKLRDSAFFGPVITRIPTGEEAGTLFDGAIALAGYPYFFELKRSRTENPQV